jgi:hypothetical protein
VGVRVGVGVAKNAAMTAAGLPSISMMIPHNKRPPAAKSVSRKQPAEEIADCER